MSSLISSTRASRPPQQQALQGEDGIYHGGTPVSASAQASWGENIVYLRGTPGSANAYYRGGSRLVRRIGRNIKESTVGRVLQLPGVSIPLAAGTAATAIASTIPPLSLGMANLLLWAGNSRICSTSPVDAFSQRSVMGGLLGTLIGTVGRGEIATELEQVLTHAGISVVLATLGSISGDASLIVSRNGPRSPYSDPELCKMAEIPGFNLMMAVLAAAMGAPICFVLVGGYRFCRSTAAQLNDSRPVGPAAVRLRLPPPMAVPEDESFNAEPPMHLVDRHITYALINEAVSTPNGDTFDRETIERVIAATGTCPITREPLFVGELRPNRVLQEQIDAWKSEHRIG